MGADSEPRLPISGTTTSDTLTLPAALWQHGGMSTTPVPLDLNRLVQAFVFASAEPVTPSLLALCCLQTATGVTRCMRCATVAPATA